jgi:hypothetical protein
VIINKFLTPQQQQKQKKKQTNSGVSLFLGQSIQSMGQKRREGQRYSLRFGV